MKKNNLPGLSEFLYLQKIRKNHGNQGYKPRSGGIHDQYVEQGPVYRAGFALDIALGVVEEFLTLIAWFVVEVVLIQTGRAAVWSASLGRWRGEKISEKEGRIYGPAGALSFLREGRRVVTANGMLFAGILVYVALAFSLLACAGSA